MYIWNEKIENQIAKGIIERWKEWQFYFVRHWLDVTETSITEMKIYFHYTSSKQRKSNIVKGVLRHGVKPLPSLGRWTVKKAVPHRESKLSCTTLQVAPVQHNQASTAHWLRRGHPAVCPVWKTLMDSFIQWSMQASSSLCCLWVPG